MMMMASTDPKSKSRKKARKPARPLQSQSTASSVAKTGLPPSSSLRQLPTRSESVIVAASTATSLKSPSLDLPTPSVSGTVENEIIASIPPVATGTARNGRRTTRSKARKVTNGNRSTLQLQAPESEVEIGKARTAEGDHKLEGWTAAETEELEEAINYSTNPTSSCNTPSPSSPAGSLSNGSSGGGGGRNGGSISATRRNFTLEFKQSVLEAFTTDPECIGNQRTTARKFNIHRRQVQKWLQQLADDKEQQSDEQRDQEDGESVPLAGNPMSKQLRKALLQPPHSVHVPPSSASFQNTPEPPIPSEARIAPTKTSMIRNRGKGRGGNTNGRTPPHSRRPTSHSHSLSAPSAAAPVSLLTSTASAFASNTRNLNKDFLTANNSSRLMPPSLNINTNPLLLGHLSMPMSANVNNNNNNNNSDHLRHSPRVSPSNMTNGNQPYGSPSANSGEGLDLSCNPNLVPLLLVDELCEMYPHEDFSLLRKALSKNSVSLTKLPPPPRRFNMNTSNNSDPSPSGRSPNSSTNDYMTQQTLQIIRQQNEYVKFLQQSGLNLPVFPPEMASTLGGMPDQSSNLPSWYHPLAHAAAAAAVGRQLPFSTNGNGNLTNNHSNSSGSSTGSNNGRKQSEHESHVFLSPKPPGSNGKVRTVAAALSATRENHSPMKKLPATRPRTAAERKGIVQTKPCTITRPPEEDFMDPTSVLEVSTSYNNEGIDLTTTASSTYHYNNTTTNTTANAATKGRGKPSRRKSDEPHSPVNNSNGPFRNSNEMQQYEQITQSTPMFPTNGHQLHAASATAGLESFIQSVLPSKKSPPDSNSNGSESECSKDMVLNAFNYDPEVKGDARGVARKFKISFRNVTKWIRESSSKLPMNGGLASTLMENHLLSLSQTNGNNSNESNEDSNNSSGSSESRPTRSVNQTHNKRKNSKPNHICDMEEDHAVNVPLNMIVPFKKRRVSTPIPYLN